MKLLPRSLAHVKGYWTAYAALVISLALTVAGYFGHNNYIRSREKSRFSQAGRLAVEQVNERLAVYLSVMKGVAAFFSGSREVTPAELTKYFASLNLSQLERNSGMDGIGVIAKVPPQEISRHVARMRTALPNYRLSTSRSNATVYPIIHFEAVGPHPGKALGWDVARDPIRSEAMARAESTGAPAMSARSRLFFSDGSQGPPGFIIYLPILAPKGSGAKPECIGYVFGAFDASELFGKIFTTPNEITALEIYDGAGASKESLLFDEDGVHLSELNYTPKRSDSIRGRLFGRPWTFVFYTRKTFEDSFERKLPGLMLALGIVGSFLFFGFVSNQTSARRTAETLSDSLRASESALRAANLELAERVKEGRRSSEALSESLSLHLATLESTGDGIMVVDTQAQIVTYNRQFLQMWGLAEPLPKDSLKLIEGVLARLADPTSFVERIKELRARPELESCDEIRLTDGRILERHSKPQRKEGQVIGRVMSFRDVTEQRRAAEKLAAEKHRLDVTLKSISDAVVATDTQGRIILMNPVAEQMCGVSQESVVGMGVEKVFPLYDPDTKAKLPSQILGVVRGEAFEPVKSTLLINAMGQQILVGLRAAPTRDSAGDITGAVFVFRDVSQERKVEQEQLRASKLESIGLLAGGIAHDFNNVLTGIVGNLSLLREYPGLSPDVSDRLALLEKSAYKARQLTMQLLTFAKGGSPIKQTASIEEVIRESAEFALRGSSLRPEFEFARDLAAVEIDTGQMSQVVQNIVINAKHAVPNGGLLRISGRNVALTGRENLPLPRGEYVRVSIEDYGTGISPEHVAKIFDPYFTTKEKGSGLGLATVYSILKRHDGLVTVESELGRGTVFHLYLPASQKSAPARTSDTTILARGSATGRILVMDDESGIRTLLTAILKHFGYEITTVRDGAEAIREYTEAREQGKPYSAVIMDLTIPGGMGGKETIRALREIDPTIKAIVSSGYSNDPVLAEYQKYGFVARVEKPYRMQELGKTLRSVLEQPHSI
jgi:PAS domain S-box-containing protein